MERLEAFQRLLLEENEVQNLVSRTTIDHLWERHIVDSAQLATLAPAGCWIDIGSGAGLPGIVIACLLSTPVRLVEPRRLRAEFLVRASAQLGLTNVEVVATKVERVTGPTDIITARAVASVTRLLEIAAHLSRPKTRWILPKGKSAQSELAEARRNWHCEAREVPSLTDPEATILILSQVEAKRSR
jgi:16S rRNA (guanine527-N7)-methyltransferase